MPFICAVASTTCGSPACDRPQPWLTTGLLRMRWKIIWSEEPQKGGKPAAAGQAAVQRLWAAARSTLTFGLPCRQCAEIAGSSSSYDNVQAFGCCAGRVAVFTPHVAVLTHLTAAHKRWCPQTRHPPQSCKRPSAPQGPHSMLTQRGCSAQTACGRGVEGRGEGTRGQHVATCTEAVTAWQLTGDTAAPVRAPHRAHPTRPHLWKMPSPPRTNLANPKSMARRLFADSSPGCSSRKFSGLRSAGRGAATGGAAQLKYRGPFGAPLCRCELATSGRMPPRTPVYDALAVAVLDHRQHGGGDGRGVCLGEELALDDHVKQLAAQARLLPWGGTEAAAVVQCKAWHRQPPTQWRQPNSSPWRCGRLQAAVGL
jgi:hypothetical protein